MKNNNPSPTNAVANLRRLMPDRPLTTIEALSLAGRQAAKFVALSGIEAPPVSDVIIGQLPRVKVERVSPLPSSGLSQWSAGRWRILVPGSVRVGSATGPSTQRLHAAPGRG